MGVFEGIANLLFLCMWRAGNGSRRAFFRKLLYVRIIIKNWKLNSCGRGTKANSTHFRFAYFSYQRPSPKSSISKKRVSFIIPNNQ